MKMTEKIMGQMIVIEVLDEVHGGEIDTVLDYFHEVDDNFSLYKKTSQIAQINSKMLVIEDAIPMVKKVFKLCQETKHETNGYFDPKIEGMINPSGLVFGYAIWEASKNLLKDGYKNYFIEIGVDIDIRGLKNGQKWKVGVVNPIRTQKKAKILNLTNCGVATSVSSNRNSLMYDPIRKKIVTEVASLTVIGPNSYEADRFCTAAFAMGVRGIHFLEEMPGFEALMVLRNGEEKITSGFENYL